MYFVDTFKLLVIHALILALIVCAVSESIETEQQLKKADEGENYVLDSVYDTMKQNYETRLSQNLETINFISDIRNKTRPNELPLLTPKNGKMFQKNLFPFEIETSSNALASEPEPVNVNPIQPRADHGHDE